MLSPPNTNRDNIMSNSQFDDKTLLWQTLGSFEHFQYSILDIDENHNTIDVIFKFAAHQQIVLHRHKALNKMLVIQGEHRLYTTDGQLKEIRPTGRYTSSPASEEPHREGGGNIDAIVLFSIRSEDELLYEILDDDLQIIATLTKTDLANLYQAQLNALMPA